MLWWRGSRGSRHGKGYQYYTCNPLEKPGLAKNWFVNGQFRAERKRQSDLLASATYKDGNQVCWRLNWEQTINIGLLTGRKSYDGLPKACVPLISWQIVAFRAWWKRDVLEHIFPHPVPFRVTLNVSSWRVGRELPRCYGWEIIK